MEHVVVVASHFVRGSMRPHDLELSPEDRIDRNERALQLARQLQLPREPLSRDRLLARFQERFAHLVDGVRERSQLGRMPELERGDEVSPRDPFQTFADQGYRTTEERT